DLSAIPAQLIDVAGVLGRLQRQDRREDLRLLRQEERPDLRDVALGPLVVPRELGPQPIALFEIGVAPQVNVLVDRPELGRPSPLELAVLVAPDFASNLRVELEVLRLLARNERVGAQLVDHERLLSSAALTIVSMRGVDRVVLAQRVPFPFL